MKDNGYITLWDTECIFVEESDGIIIIPKDKDNFKNFRPHFRDENFILKYCGLAGNNSIAFIEQVRSEPDYAIKLIPKYIVKDSYDNSFTGFEMIGEVIDDFFSPSRYFYDRSKSGVDMNEDFIYHDEVAEEWTIVFEGKSIIIALSYGGILYEGIASDLMLHPKLRISFEKTTDVQYVYRIYLFVERFLQIVRYDTNCGTFRIDLYSERNGKPSYNGYLNDIGSVQNHHLKRYNDVEYGCYKPYIQRFLQFAADNPKYTANHYPTEGIRFRGRQYSAVDYMNIFTAFESECHAKEDVYENADAEKVQIIKDSLVARLDEYSKENLQQEEKEFLENAKKRILQLGTQLGQTRKIINAYHILHNALDSSIENIFNSPGFKLKGPLQDKDLKKIAKVLVRQRGSIVHGGFSGPFSDMDAQRIRFLEILTYAQLLRRIGLEDADIERVIGALFRSNYVLFHENYH
ncbi:MAG: hypothetical protein ACI4K6_02730 [Candidatus Fimenecus sp.]